MCCCCCCCCSCVVVAGVDWQQSGVDPAQVGAGVVRRTHRLSGGEPHGDTEEPPGDSSQGLSQALHASGLRPHLHFP